MKIYIPKHLRNLKLIDNLARMIEEYSRTQTQSSSDSFGNYYEALSEDPVEKFVRLAFTKERFEQGIKTGSRSSLNFTPYQSYDEVIKYLTKLFYSVKGTPKVGEYITKYLIDTESIYYDGSKVGIYIDTIDLEDEGEWSSSFEGFLNSLLYFEELALNMKQVNMEIKEKLDNNLGSNLVCYKEFNIQEIL